MNRQQTLIELKQSLEVYRETSVIVEGKRDAAALQELGFSRVFILNEHQGSMRERIERIASQLAKKENVCLLFDNDATGRKLIAQCAPIAQELGFRLNQSLRKAFVKARLSHVEGIATFLGNGSK